MSLLQRAQTRLAKLDELRQAAKTGAVLRLKREREELGTKVNSRIQQAEANRMLLLQAHLQRRAAVQERKSQSLLKRMHREKKYRECVQAAIYQKRVAAERKRLGLLEAEKTRAHAKVIRAYRVAKSVYHQRETERRKMKEQLEARLQRVKKISHFFQLYNFLNSIVSKGLPTEVLDAIIFVCYIVEYSLLGHLLTMQK